MPAMAMGAAKHPQATISKQPHLEANNNPCPSPSISITKKGCQMASSSSLMLLSFSMKDGLAILANGYEWLGWVISPAMSNQQLVDAGMKKMEETDQAIERSKMVVEQTIEVGAQTAANLKGQTEQMGRIVNELDTIQFSIKKASQLVKEIGRQVATDKCIMAFLFLIVCGVIAIIIVKIVNPHNKDIRDIPGLAPPAPTARRLLSVEAFKGFQ
ncbi:hypothetical protein COCNU_01G015520 [Cocos nucifera]|uniref:t-SNARE coiled-coil homology domain-containing protein n=1 Tax=Cocos nucifera TaxID=13894 RepID=A0A8K0HWU5_COCNU|nr:hypothetical protein COCNU_01G015520 [Cocos nucifera]